MDWSPMGFFPTITLPTRLGDSVVAVELVPQRVNRRRSFSTLMLTLGDIVLVRLASNIIRYGCNGNILIFRKSSLIRYNLFNYYNTQ